MIVASPPLGGFLFTPLNQQHNSFNICSTRSNLLKTNIQRKKSDTEKVDNVHISTNQLLIQELHAMVNETMQTQILP